MGLRYRKSINVGGGFRVNVSKTGIGGSWGVKGARFTKTATGRNRVTLSLPGTGISYVKESSGKKRSGNRKRRASASIPSFLNKLIMLIMVVVTVLVGNNFGLLAGVITFVVLVSVYTVVSSYLSKRAGR